MSGRYFVHRGKCKARPRSEEDYWSDDIPRPSNLEVCDHEPTDTGLVDVDGYPIMRAPNPIGFIW